MDFLLIMALAVALAMDAFAVAVTAGMRLRCISLPQTFRMAGTFGFFQFAMPVTGWMLGIGVYSHIEAYDHWLAFILLFFVGARMLKEAWDKRGKTPAECACGPNAADPTRGTSLFFLGIATSIDALAVGLSMAMLGQQVWRPALIIGAVCFALTAVGMHVGRIVCALSGNWTNRANAFGGLVLIGIGCNILREHGAFG